MMKAFAMIAVAGLASVAGADLVDVGWYVQDGLNGTVRPYNGENDLEAYSTVYRNWAGGTIGGTGVYTANVAAQGGGGRLHGDDTAIVPNGIQRLTSMGLNVANLNPVGQRLVSFTGTVQFFNAGLAPIGGFGFNSNLSSLAGGGLDGGGGSIRISFSDGSLDSLNIFLTNVAYTTWTFDTAVFTNGGTINTLGLQIRNPTDVGSSNAGLMVLNNGIVPVSGQSANTSIFIRTDNVPTPGALALLGLGGLAAARRRR